MKMDMQRAIEIIQRKSSIPMDGESFDEICEAYDLATEALKMQGKLKEWIEDYKKPCYDETWSKEELLDVLEEFLVEE